jgi:NADH-quinone oxidoreductase subunit K
MAPVPVIPLYHFVVLAAVLFGLGALGVLIRRNALVVFMSIELMLNAVNLTILAFARYRGLPEGHAIVFFVMAVAAAEAAIGLAIILNVFRVRRSVNVDDAAMMRN